MLYPVLKKEDLEIALNHRPVSAECVCKTRENIIKKTDGWLLAKEKLPKTIVHRKEVMHNKSFRLQYSELCFRQKQQTR